VTDEETEEEDEPEQPSAEEAIIPVAPVGTISTPPAAPELEAAPVPPTIVAPAPQQAPSRPGILPRLFSSSRRPGLTPSQSHDDSTPTTGSRPASRSGAETPKAKRPKFKRGRGTKDSTYNFGAEKDVLGIVLFEVNKAEDLPKFKNSMSSFDLRLQLFNLVI
jgi:phosphatidylserine decarboxylase